MGWRDEEDERNYDRWFERQMGRDPDERERDKERLRRAGCDEWGRDLSH